MAPTLVSLVPSLTELLFWFGLGDSVLGRTRFCTEPAGEVERVRIIGGTKNPNIERIVALQPGLVLANKEENRKEDIEALQATGLRVHVTDPNSVAEAAATVRQLGGILGVQSRADELASATETAVAGGDGAGLQRRVFVPIWKEPLMGLGGMSYGDDVLRCAGGVNVLGGRPRYPEVTLEEVAALHPELVLLPDEPYPFKASDAAMFADVAPGAVIDGKLLWWYGPRMPDSLRTLRELLRRAEAG